MKIKPLYYITCFIFALAAAVYLAVICFCRVLMLLWNLAVGNSTQILPHYHPDIFLSHIDIITLPGFKVQEYTVETEDHVTLMLWRIINVDGSAKKNNVPVLFMHGLMDSGLTYFGQEDINISFPYTMAKEGYDVWVGNNRGNRFTNNNGQEGFWDYVFDHLAKYDITAIVNSVLSHSSSESLVFVGHSQGSLQLLSALSEGYIEESKIKSYIGLGPILSIYNNKSSFVIQMITKIPLIEFLLKLGFKSALVLPQWSSRLTGVLMCNSKMAAEFAMWVVNIFCGFPKTNKLTHRQLARVIANEPGGCALTNILQWKQFGSQERMRYFDYGRCKNLEIYKQEVPPEYQLHKIMEYRFSKCIFIGSVDVMMKHCLLSLKYFKDCARVVMLEDYNHNDYLWSPSAYEDIYKPSLQFLKENS